MDYDNPDYYNSQMIIDTMPCGCFANGKDIFICLCCGACKCGESSGLAEHQIWGLEKSGLLTPCLFESHREYWGDE